METTNYYKIGSDDYKSMISKCQKQKGSSNALSLSKKC